ncbi:hypothetical protein QEN19_001370 [Hanseniaspora menglaensis]
MTSNKNYNEPESDDIFWSDSASINSVSLHSAEIKHDDPHYKQGYVDGVSTFDNNVIQKNCDSTFKTGNEIGYRVGKIVGKIQFHLRDDEANKKVFLEKLNINNILQEKNFDDEYLKFINVAMLENIDAEVNDLINGKKS